MFLDIFSKNNLRYIRISESKRVEVNGKRVPKKVTVKSIGPVSKFDDGKPDFEKRLRDSFNAGTPLIEELKPYVKNELPKEVYHLDIHAGTDECVGEPKLIANLLFDKFLEDIGLRSFIGSYKNYDDINYDILGFFKLALYGRVLNPQSKISTVFQNDDYFSPIIKDKFYNFNIYDMLDFIYKHKDGMFNRVDSYMRKNFGRTTNKIYYDVTNFFFQIDNPDKETFADGDKITGLRQYGVCKEERHAPIVQMGLLMDEQGYPISIETFTGNTLDHLTLQKSFNNAPENTKNSRYIFVSDKGIGRGDNMSYAVKNGNGYVVSKSVRGSTKNDKEWMCEQSDYTCNKDGTFKSKSRIYEKNFTLPDGTTVKSSEKEVVYWSKKFYDKEYNEKKNYYDFLKKLIESPENFKITKIEASGIGRYIKRDLLNTETGELIDSKTLKAQLDMDKLKKEYELLGYYSIITSETELEDEEIINIYHNLVKIEDEFRTMKATLESRPMFVKTPEHITAHLTICTLALIFIRIIQNRIKKYMSEHPESFENTDIDRSFGLSGDRIRNALNHFTVEKIADEYYRFNNLKNKDLKLILDAFGIKIPLKLYKISELKHIKQTL